MSKALINGRSVWYIDGFRDGMLRNGTWVSFSPPSDRAGTNVNYQDYCAGYKAAGGKI